MNTQNKMKLKKVLLGIVTLGLLGFGATRVAKSTRNRPHDQDEEKQEETKNKPETYQDFKQRMHPLTPSIMLETILVEGVKLDTAGLCEPYQDGKGIWTIGFGLTQMDGKSVTKNTRHITLQEAWEKSVQFYEDQETYFFMWCYEIGLDSLDIDSAAKACALASIIYNSGTKIIENPDNSNHKNRNTELRKLYKRYGDKVTAAQVIGQFKKYPVQDLTSFGTVLNNGDDVKKWADALGGFTAEGGGIYWRRWLEGQMAMGNITPKDLLDLPTQSMYDFFKYFGGKKSVFFNAGPTVNNKALVQFHTWAANPVDKNGNKIARKTLRQVIDEIDPELTIQIEQGGNFERRIGPKPRTITLAAASQEMFKEKYNAACAAFDSAHFNSAREQFEMLVAEYPNNARLRNDLAVTYNNLGLYDDALACTKYIFNTLKDSTQYAAAYYNAGVAREKMGNYESALANYQSAIKHGNKSKSVTDAAARMDRAIKSKARAHAYLEGTWKLNARMNNRAATQNAQMHGHRTYNA